MHQPYEATTHAAEDDVSQLRVKADRSVHQAILPVLAKRPLDLAVYRMRQNGLFQRRHYQ